MKCKVCGNELEKGSKFCGNCGTKVKKEEYRFMGFRLGVLFSYSGNNSFMEKEL